MPGISVPREIDNRNSAYIEKIAGDFTGFDSAFAAGGITNPGVQLQKIKAFFESAGKKHGCEEEASHLSGFFGTFLDNTTYFTSKFTFINGKRLDTVADNFNKLLGLGEEAGLSETLDAFNKKTDFAYAETPEIKTMYSVLDRTERAAVDFETYTVTEFNEGMSARADKISGIIDSLNRLNAGKAEIRTRAEKHADIKPADYIATAEKLEKTVEQLDAKISGEKAEAEKTENEILQARKKTEENAENTEDRKKHIESGTIYIENLKAERKTEETRAMIAAQMASSEKENRESSVRNAEAIIENGLNVINGFNNSLSAEKMNRLRSAADDMTAALNFGNSLNKIGEAAGEKPGITGDILKKLKTEDGRKSFLNSGNEAYAQLAKFASDYIAVYDRANPAPPKTFFSRFRGEKHTDGNAKLNTLIDSAGTENAFGAFSDGVRASAKEIKTGIINNGKAFFGDGKFTETLQSYINARGDIERGGAMLSRAGDVLGSAEKEAEAAGHKIEAVDRLIAGVGESIKRAEETIKELAADTEAQKAVITEKTAKAEEINAVIADDERTRANVIRSAEELRKLESDGRHYAADVMITKGIIGNYCTEFRPCEKFNDTRLERADKRIDGFIRRTADNQGSHTNTAEYNDLVTALINARGADADRFEEAAANLRDAARTYLEKKGTRTFSFGSLRQTRLTLAREIAQWAETATDMLNVRPAGYDVKTVEQDRNLRAINTSAVLSENAFAAAENSAGHRIQNTAGADVRGRNPGIGEENRTLFK